MGSRASLLHQSVSAVPHGIKGPFPKFPFLRGGVVRGSTQMNNGKSTGRPDKGAATGPDSPHYLTTRQGHPVSDNQNSRTVGDRGPAALENYQLLEKISHFDRERVPERVVHARGAGAHGYFEAYGTIGDAPASKYTRAKLFQAKGK